MLTGDLKSKIDQIWNAFWSGGIANLIEALKTTHRTAVAPLDALFASLQQRAFAGELTVQAPTAVSVSPAKRSFAELGQLNALKGVESLVYAAKRLKGKGHYWPTKVQYFADKRHRECYGRTLYRETYVAMERGPASGR